MVLLSLHQGMGPMAKVRANIITAIGSVLLGYFAAILILSHLLDPMGTRILVEMNINISNILNIQEILVA